MRLFEVEQKGNFEEVSRTSAKVVLRLKSKESAQYTNLAKKVARISQLADETKKLKDEVKEETRVLISDLFSAEDKVLTRVVETNQAILTLSKDPSPTVSTKWAAVVTEFKDHLTPELLEKLKEIEQKYESISQKAPGLKVSGKLDELRANTDVAFVLSDLKEFKAQIDSWAMDYDRRLDAIKQMFMDDHTRKESD